MSVLVTGASGFIGRRLVARLAADGYAVRASVHRTLPVLPTGCEAVQCGPIGPETDWSAALADVEAIVHLAARAHVIREMAADPLHAFRQVNAEGTRRLAEQGAARGVRRFVLVSSIGVLGRSTDGRPPFRPEDPPEPESPYAQSKLEAERALWAVASASGMEGAVVRPPLVYGPKARGNLDRLTQLIARGVPLPLASVDNARSMIGLDNLVDLLVACLRQPGAAGRTLLAADGEDISTPALIRRLATAMGRRAFLLPTPPGLLRAAGRALGRQNEVAGLIGSLQVDIAATRSALQWTPPVSVEDGIRRAVAAPAPASPSLAKEQG
jgi:nucleoside-diphosphate-sugar epimerase